MGLLRRNSSLINLPLIKFEIKPLYDDRMYIGKMTYSTSVMYFNNKSDPSKIDTDGDTYIDGDDIDPLTFDYQKGLLFQSSYKIGMNVDGNDIAPDLTYNDYSTDELIALNPLFFLQANSVDVSFVKTDFLGMASMFIWQDSGIDLFLEQFDKFTNGTNQTIQIETENETYTVPCYSSNLLTQALKNDEKTQEYINFVKNTLNDELVKNNGDIIKAKNGAQGVIGDSELSKLAFKHDESNYLFNGMTICVDNVWGHNISIKNYSTDGETFSGTLHFKLYDHFGLDPNDVSEKYGYLARFRAWFCLQHHTKYEGRYKPFINLMEFDVNFSGTL